MRTFDRIREEGGDMMSEGGGGGAEELEVISPFSSFYGESGLNREAVERLPASAAPIRGMLEKYANEDALYGGIKNLQYLASQKSLAKLPADADDNQKAQHAQMVREYFGTPDHPEGYGIERPEHIPEEIWGGDQTQELIGVLHKHNASPELVRELSDLRISQFEQLMSTAPEQEKARIDTVNNELKAAFGNDLPKVTESAMKGLRMLGIEPPESGQVADMKISYAAILAAGQRLTELVSEDTMSRGMGNHDAQTFGSYRDQAHAIKTDPTNPFNQDFNSEDPSRQKRAQAEFRRLMNLANVSR